MPCVRAIKQLRQRCQARIIPQQGLEERLGARRRQGIEPQLRVVGLAAPAVLVLRAIVDQQQEPGRRQALDQAIEQGLRLGIDPVQVLEDEQQGLHLAFPQQQALDGLQRALAALRGIEAARKGLVHRQGLQEREQRWERALQGRVQRQELAGDLARAPAAPSSRLRSRNRL